MPSPSLPSVSFLGLRIAACSPEQFIDWAVAAANARAAPARIGYLNAATFNLACDSPEMAALLSASDCLYADGQSVVCASRHLGAPVPERMTAPDFINPFLARCAAEGIGVAFIGGKPGEASAAAERLQSAIPGLLIEPIHHGYFNETDEAKILAFIESADPGVVLLGMGSPLQERLAARWSVQGRPRVWWCVGALFEYLSDSRARAPRWMRRAGMEWAFRLALEPGRLAGRYLIGNPKFIWRVLRKRKVR